MAEIKREIRTLGQRLSGLTAGNQYTFVLKRPNVRVDVLNATRGIEIAETQILALRKMLMELERVRDEAIRGSAETARSMLKSVKETVRTIQGGVSDAKEFALRAAEDAKDAHADVKDAYNAAKDGAAHASAIAEKLMAGVTDLLKAVSALIVEAEIREPPPAAAPASTTDGS